MNNPDHISEVWVKILKFFDADPGWKNSDPGSAILVRIKENISQITQWKKNVLKKA
jgi:hypothetical protein